jgi:hypothetical protein
LPRGKSSPRCRNRGVAGITGRGSVSEAGPAFDSAVLIREQRSSSLLDREKTKKSLSALLARQQQIEKQFQEMEDETSIVLALFNMIEED